MAAAVAAVVAPARATWKASSISSSTPRRISTRAISRNRPASNSSSNNRSMRRCKSCNNCRGGSRNWPTNRKRDNSKRRSSVGQTDQGRPLIGGEGWAALHNLDPRGGSEPRVGRLPWRRNREEGKLGGLVRSLRDLDARTQGTEV